MKRKEIIFYMMHEMHSLLFAALETFSLILLRKKKNPKSGGIAFLFDLLCESAAVLLTLSQFVRSLTSFTQIQINEHVFFFLRRYLKDSS